MTTVKLFEQEVINALCVYISRKESISPEEVMVELLFDDDTGFSVEAEFRQQRQFLKEPVMIQALRKWVQFQHGLDPFSAGLQLELDDQEGIVAYVK
ncbi:DUF2653 family protein [Heyndrickxia acidicola]|uniref:DUF2653 family protein n=1 Tax=Heyndrickxia acidicola TaxID=209389 RepID=A0ABU6MAB1_9BACI|nr:DUF2653 family protein [Heyndrickxia acidicola]MED1201611.1 DUF2653 family protein [Heyndrickxia acidicola]